MSGLGVGGGTPQIDWRGWRKFSRTGQNCPKCGAPMVNRTAFTECSSCHHIEHKPTTARERSTLDPVREKVEESIREALPEARMDEPRFITFELPCELNGERLALRGAAGLWIILQWLYLESGRSTYHAGHGGAYLFLDWLPFVTLAVMAITYGVMYATIPQLKYAWGVASIILGSVSAIALGLGGLGIAGLEFFTGNPDTPTMWFAVYSIVYFLWAGWFLFREARMMQQ
jgi:hypothetical protein